MPPTNNRPCTLLLTRHWQRNTVCFPGLPWLSRRQRPCSGSGGHSVATPIGLGCRSSLIRLLSVCTEKCGEVGIFQRRDIKSISCFLLPFVNRKFCSVKNAYIQNGLESHRDHIHNELSWDFDGLLTHPSAQLPLGSKV